MALRKPIAPRSSSLCCGRWTACPWVLLLLLSFTLIPEVSATQDAPAAAQDAPVEALVTESTTVPIPLPKLGTLPKPLDDKVRVALLLSECPDLSAYLVTFSAAPLADKHKHWYTVDKVKIVSDYGSNTAKVFTISLMSPASSSRGSTGIWTCSCRTWPG